MCVEKAPAGLIASEWAEDHGMEELAATLNAVRARRTVCSSTTHCAATLNDWHHATSCSTFLRLPACTWLVFAATLRPFAMLLNNVHDVCAALPLAVHTHGASYLTVHEL
jgi:hypothetical protein